MIDGKVHYFESRGLYDGVSLMMDLESGSLWHHITGEALHGPLAGKRLTGASNLLHMTVEAALNAYPDLPVAISDRPIKGRPSRMWAWAERVPVLRDRFRSTMLAEDTRRPTMDVGLGVWNDAIQLYYPMEHVLARDEYVIDELDGRRLLVYFDPVGRALSAFFTEATSATWEGDELHLDTGEVVRGGALVGADGNRRHMERPLQMFTRWYGYALMFPEAQIYEPEGSTE